MSSSTLKIVGISNLVEVYNDNITQQVGQPKDFLEGQGSQTTTSVVPFAECALENIHFFLNIKKIVFLSQCKL